MNQLSERANAGPGIQSQDMAAIGYLFRSSIDGDRIEDEELERYRNAEQSWLETLAQLPYWRGNVSDDIEKTGNASARRQAAAEALRADLTADNVSEVTLSRILAKLGADSIDQRLCFLSIKVVKREARYNHTEVTHLNGKRRTNVLAVEFAGREEIAPGPRSRSILAIGILVRRPTDTEFHTHACPLL